jgi:DNA-binding NtrC family response regulator
VRRERFLIPLSCGLLDAELLETAIMDFVQGPSEVGIESPMTILLLDADRLVPDAQTHLMRILRQSERNIHTLATSERCLIELAAEGSFREDLAYHLSTLVIELPDLASRPDDIPLLAQYLLERQNGSGKKQLSGFAPRRWIGFPVTRGRATSISWWK